MADQRTTGRIVGVQYCASGRKKQLEKGMGRTGGCSLEEQIVVNQSENMMVWWQNVGGSWGKVVQDGLFDTSSVS